MTENEYTSETSRVSREPIERERVFERDNYTCQNCGEKYEGDSNILEISYKEHPPEGDPNDPDNMISLCPNCHKRFDMGNLGEQIASSLQEGYETRAKARNHASTVEAFAGDSIEITKLNVLIVSVAGTAITVLLQTNIISEPSTLSNVGMMIGVSGLVLSTIFAFLAYYSCRTSGTSPAAVDDILEGGSDEDVSEETTEVYTKNANKIGVAIGLTLFSVLSLIAGVGIAIV